MVENSRINTDGHKEQVCPVHVRSSIHACIHTHCPEMLPTHLTAYKSRFPLPTAHEDEQHEPRAMG